MRRRAVIAGLVASLALDAKRTILAQLRASRAAIGFLGGASPERAQRSVNSLLAGFKELGYVEGETFYMIYRFASGHLDRTPALARELALLKPDAVVAANVNAAVAMREVDIYSDRLSRPWRADTVRVSRELLSAWRERHGGAAHRRASSGQAVGTCLTALS